MRRRTPVSEQPILPQRIDNPDHVPCNEGGAVDPASLLVLLVTLVDEQLGIRPEPTRVRVGRVRPDMGDVHGSPDFGAVEEIRGPLLLVLEATERERVAGTAIRRQQMAAGVPAFSTSRIRTEGRR